MPPPPPFSSIRRSIIRNDLANFSPAYSEYFIPRLPAHLEVFQINRRINQGINNRRTNNRRINRRRETCLMAGLKD